MVLSVGVDLIEIARIRRAIERWGKRFLDHVYTPAEVAYCRGRVPELAARFAGKEAISKALGTGLYGIAWTEMEILADRRGQAPGNPLRTGSGASAGPGARRVGDQPDPQ